MAWIIASVSMGEDYRLRSGWNFSAQAANSENPICGSIVRLVGLPSVADCERLSGMTLYKRGDI